MFLAGGLAPCSITAQPGSEPASPPGINISSAATMPALPTGAIVTSVTISYPGIDPLTSSFQNEVRLGLSGAVILAGSAGTGSLSYVNTPFNYSATSPPSAFNTAGGPVYLTYWDSYNDYGSADAVFPTGTGIATAVISYSYPASIQWYTAATGGTAFASGSPLNPATAAGSGLSGTGTPGSYTFYAGAQNASGCSSTTRTAATFTIAPLVAITTQPAAQTLCAGQALSLSVVASNATGYQRKLNGNNIGGATSATYSVASAAAANAGSYTVVVSGNSPCASLASSAASVTVTPAVSITTQPSSQAACAGLPLTLSVVAANASGYQWKLNGASIAGATAATYSLASATLTDAGSYSVTVSDNNACSTASNSVAVVIDAPTPTITAPASVCLGEPAALVTLNASGGVAPYTYTYNINGGASQTASTTNVSARYIHIVQNQADWFNLAEMRAIQAGTGANVAAGKTGTSNAVNPSYPVVRLTDGILTNYFHSSTTAAGNWVEIHLGAEYTLSEIKIVNRQDCCQSRSSNLQLTLKNGAGTQLSSQQVNAYQGQNTNFISTHPVPYNSSVTVPANTAAAGVFQYNLVSVSSVNGCATTSAASAAMTVNAIASITAEPQAGVALCAGNPLILSVAASDAVSYQWRKGNVNISGATGGSYAVPFSTAASAGSYRAIAIGGGCNDTSAISTVAVTPMATTLAAGGAAVSSAQPDGYSLVYTDAPCLPIASITDVSGGNLLGMTAASVFVDDSVNTLNSVPYLQRHYDLTPASNGPATVKLYATQAEFDAFNEWIAANGDALPRLPTDSSDATGIGHIAIRQFHGLPSSGTTGPGGQYDATASEVISNTAINTTWNGSYWTMSFPVSAFSGFFIGSALSAALPVELVSFDAKASGAANLVSWKSASEVMLEAYAVERSADGRTFTTLATVAAAGKAHDYHYPDDRPLTPVSYYRLRMTDADGSYRYSKTESVVRGQGNGTVAMNVYPNPAKNVLTVQVQGSAPNGQVTLRDLSGRTVLRSALSGSVAELDVHALASGVYFVTYEGNGVKEVTKVTVAH